MKKKMTFLGLLIAMIMTVSAVGFVYANEAKAALDVSVTNLQLLDVKMASINDTDNTAKRVSFTINRNLGGNPFPGGSPTIDKIVYTAANGGTRALSAVNYRLVNTVPTLVFSFNGDTGTDAIAYAVGDTLTVKAGFSFANWNGGDLAIKFLADQTFTYTAEGWTGTFIDASLSAPTLSVGQIGVSGNALIVDFGVTGTGAESNGVVDKESGWYADPRFAPAKLVYNNENKYVDYMRNGVEYERTRYLFADGKFGVDLGAPGTDNDPIKGDTVILKKGFVAYSITSINGIAGYPENDNNYRPYFVLHNDMLFYYDGATWTTIVKAKTANFTNTPDEKAALRVGTTLQLTWGTDAEAKEPVPTFTTSAENIATVSSSGLVTGIAEGEVTITAKFMDISAAITLTVGAPLAKDKILATVTNGCEKDGKKYLVAYKGVDLIKADIVSKISAKFGFNDGAVGTDFTVTADMLDLTPFNNSVAGETKIIIKNENISGDIPVFVYDVKTIDPVLPKKIVSFGNAIDLHFETQIEGNESVAVKTIDFRGENPYGIQANMLEFREPTHAKTDTVYEFYTVGQASNKQMLIYFGNVDGSKMKEERVGSVLTLKENFRFYRFTDNYWVEAYKLSAPASYVWDGAEWKNFVVDSNDVTLSETSVNLPLNAEYAPKYTILPANSYVTPTITSDDATIASVENGKIIGKAIGNTTIKVSVGENIRTITVNVMASNPTSFVLVNDRIFNVAKNAVFDITKVNVKLDFGNEFYGETFNLTEENTEYTLDTTKIGKQNISVKITHTEFGKTVVANITIKVEVHDLIEQVPNSLWDVNDVDWAGGTIMIHFENTFSNGANVFPSDLTEDERPTITDHISYTRKGATVTINNPGYLKHMFAFGPQIDGETLTSYLVGDQIKLTKGLRFYKYFGDLDANNVPQNKENGDFTLVGELKYDVLFTYTAAGKFWMSIDYADAKVLSETVTVGLGAKHASNVAIVPEYATNGEWTFTVQDESIASVNLNGLISAKKIGSTLVTAVLDGGVAGKKTVTFTINVVDTVSGIGLSQQKIKLTKGSELNAQTLKDLGITAKLKYASGKIDGDVDLKNAKISGYDSDKLGEQTVVIRVSVDGKSITGELIVEVADPSVKKGCGSVIGGTLGGGITLLALGFAICLVLIKRKKTSQI